MGFGLILRLNSLRHIHMPSKVYLGTDSPNNLKESLPSAAAGM